eukprot:1136143-Pelagomonas_calceolata.AAC.6
MFALAQQQIAFVLMCMLWACYPVLVLMCMLWACYPVLVLMCMLWACDPVLVLMCMLWACYPGSRASVCMQARACMCPTSTSKSKFELLAAFICCFAASRRIVCSSFACGGTPRGDLTMPTIAIMHTFTNECSYFLFALDGALYSYLAEPTIAICTLPPIRVHTQHLHTIMLLAVTWQCPPTRSLPWLILPLTWRTSMCTQLKGWSACYRCVHHGFVNRNLCFCNLRMRAGQCNCVNCNTICVTCMCVPANAPGRGSPKTSRPVSIMPFEAVSNRHILVK